MSTLFKTAFEKSANVKSIGSAIVNRMGKSTVKGTSGLGRAASLGIGAVAVHDVGSSVGSAMNRPKNMGLKSPSFFSHAR